MGTRDVVDVLEEFGVGVGGLEEWVVEGGAGEGVITGEGIQVLGGE